MHKIRPKLGRSCRCILMLGHGYEPVVDFVLLILQYSNFPISSNFLGILKPLSTLLKFSTQLNTINFHIRPLYHPSLDFLQPPYILTFLGSSWLLLNPLQSSWHLLTSLKSSGLLLTPFNLPWSPFDSPWLKLAFKKMVTDIKTERKKERQKDMSAS